MSETKKPNCEIRVGDEFEVRVRVRGPSLQYSNAFRVEAVNAVEEDCVSFYRETLLASKRVARPIAVGDRVRGRPAQGSLVGAVVAICGDEAWINQGTPEFPSCFTRPLLSLTRVDESDPA